MAATYKRTSPYYNTEMFGTALDVLSLRPIPKQVDDVKYVIKRAYKYRPDLLAFDLYGDAALWWVFAVRNPNVLKDPVFDFIPGVKIKIPKKQTLVDTLGI